MFGPIEVVSAYLRDPVRKVSARPTKDILKLTHHGRSPGVERALTDFGAEESFARAAQRFEEHYGWSIGRTTVLRVVESRAREAETYVEQRLESAAALYDEPLAKRPGVEALLVEMDGCELRTGTLAVANSDAVSEVRRLPKRRREEAWRDVRMAFARELGATERTYVGHMGSYGAIGKQLFAAAVDRGLSEKTQVVAVADGGQGLREELDSRFANLRFILDRPHFKSHLYETAAAMGLADTAREAWVARMTNACEKGEVASVIVELRAHKGRGKKRCRRLAGYLTRFKDAVHYEAIREAGYPTGSGEIESVHRYIPQKRLKLPGACWHPDTINPMLALRVMRENGWWEDFWETRNAA